MALLVTGTFTGNTNSNVLTLNPHGIKFNIYLRGLTSTGATVTVQRSFDGGSTWGNAMSYTADIETFGEEPSADVQYRLACSGYTSGTIAYGLGY